MRYNICDKQPNSYGYHEVHTVFCPALPLKSHQENVGQFANCNLAIKTLYDLNKGRRFKFIGCRLCCRPCYSSVEH